MIVLSQTRFVIANGEIANVFNNYFSSIASQTKVNIKHSHKHFSDFLKNRAQNSFF